MPDINIDLTLAKTVNFTVQAGDTWDDFSLVMTENNAPMNLTGAKVTVDIRKDFDDVKPWIVLATVSSPPQLRIQGSTVIMDAKPLVSLRPGIYDHMKIIFEFPSGRIVTYHKGKVIVEP